MLTGKSEQLPRDLATQYTINGIMRLVVHVSGYGKAPPYHRAPEPIAQLRRNHEFRVFHMDLRRNLRAFEDAGVDQAVFIQQGGRNQHAHICEALELFARDVMPEFKARTAAREARKQAELAPYVAKAMARRKPMPQLADADIPVYMALGRRIAEQGGGTERQKASQKLWEKVAQASLEDPLRHGIQARKPAAE